ncbi:hypothetical protein HRV96_11070 [Raoultella ornithinolytica]|uniref:glycine-rich domain-containing protein n=1 Tax=Raoultella ornithinolytica TaxID=54291 RepID=UPI001F45FC34|nr:hypothetical protein [Raoultella ornithinolytica]UIZ73774.1 hypothetical protein HRV96_11070 [Raoultella ornithinolytica]
MQKVGNTTDTADANGEYTNGNVANGILPTIINAEMLNTFQRELVNTVEGSGLVLDPSNNHQLLEAIKKLTSPGRLLGIKVITSTQTYTPSTGTKKIIIEMVGGGGAGGSVDTGTASGDQVPGGAAAGGEGGAYGTALIDPVFSSALVTIGKAGTASINSPVDGETTSISVNGTVLLSVSGGATGTTMKGPYAYPATLGGRRTTANIFTGNFLLKVNGKPGGLGTIFSPASAAGGDGGASYLSNGSPQGLLNNDTNVSLYEPTGYGCGGTGACAISRSQTGGAASDGLVIIKEYA